MRLGEQPKNPPPCSPPSVPDSNTFAAVVSPPRTQFAGSRPRGKRGVPRAMDLQAENHMLRQKILERDVELTIALSKLLRFEVQYDRLLREVQYDRHLEVQYDRLLRQNARLWKAIQTAQARWG